MLNINRAVRILELDKILEMLEPIACTGLKCPLKSYCQHFRNHELKNTKSYFMADFDSEKGMCINYKQLK